MNKPKLDYNNVSEAILQKCNQLLLNVDVNTVSDAFDAVSEIVEIAIEKYSFDVSDYWKVENTNADIERKIRFTDINEGYEILVKNGLSKILSRLNFQTYLWTRLNLMKNTSKN